MMAIDRRDFLAAGAALLAAPSLAGSRSAVYAAPRYEASGAASIALVSGTGTELVSAPLPSRAHDVALSPDGQHLVVIARRAGWHATVLRSDTLAPVYQFRPPERRHFYGHGCFSSDGTRFFTTENAFDDGEGLIGVYDASHGFRRVAEWSSGGVGPHDLTLTSDGRALCVANGGIRTHPESGRDMLNLDSMAPNLTLLALESGAIISQITLGQGLRHLSLRHLALGAGNAIIVGGQFEGADEDCPALVGAWRNGRELELWDMPDAALRRMNNYVGSVMLNRRGDVVAATSPKGNSVAFFEARSGRYVGLQAMKEVCAVAPADDHGFLLSSGEGRLATATAEALKPLARNSAVAWDNHMRAM